jgi:small subunit ribosomal protein S21
VDWIEDLGSALVLVVYVVLLSILEGAGMEVTLRETDRLEYVLKKFRREITKAGLFQDMKKKRFYESPAVQRRRKSKAARRRKRTS